MSNLQNNTTELENILDMANNLPSSSTPSGGAVTSVNGKTGDVELSADDVGALSQDKLQDGVNLALQQAKESGEFNGKDGEKGEKGETGPQGEKGEKGETGAQGEKGEQGIPGEKGETGAAGKDGADGKDGANGTDGRTPEKGVDYFTEADKAEMVNAVIAALPAAEGASF